MGFLDKAKQRAQDAQRKLEESGALDKARHAAQQAQEKLEQKQQDAGRSQSGGSGQAAGRTRYDQQGRPIEQPPSGDAAQPSSAERPEPASPAAPPAPATPDPAPPAPGSEQPQDPVTPSSPAQPASGEPGGEGAMPTEEAPPRQEPREGMNRNPDPFRPIERG